MQYRRIGAAGLSVSVVGLGSWLTFGETLGEAETKRCVDTALDAGINLFDTADVYAKGDAERLLGRALKNVSRGRYVVATKCFFPTGDGVNERGLSRKHVIEACNASLLRLGLDSIDLYQCHRYDETVRLEETAGAMTDLVRAGKVHYWGFSQWPAAAIHEVMRLTGSVAPISDQARYSMLDRDIEGDVVDACEEHGLGVLAYSPLAQGVLTGKYGSGVPEGSRAAAPRTAAAIEWRLKPEHLAKAEALKPIAADAGVPLATLALAWCLRSPVVASVLTGATRAEHIEDNVRAASLTLSDETLRRIEQVLRT